MRAQLPPVPDFATVEAAAPAFVDRQSRIMTLIGNLVLSWSNDESMFVYVLMLLLDVDDVSAAVVFTTLNTTRARLDLVRRLAAIKVTDKAVAQVLTRLMRRFDACTKVRNEFNHCIYTLNDHGEIVSTHMMRIQEAAGQLSLGATRAMDEARIKEIGDTLRQLKRLNRELWMFLPLLKAHLDGGARRVPAADSHGA